MTRELTPLHLFLLVGASTVLFPVMYLVTVTLMGVSVIEPSPLVFGPMGTIAGGFLAYWMNKAESRQGRLLLTIGYLVACPIAFIGAMFMGFVFGPWLGTLIFGAGPLIVGSFIGYKLGQRFEAE